MRRGNSGNLHGCESDSGLGRAGKWENRRIVEGEKIEMKACVAVEMNHGEEGKFACFSAIDEQDNDLRNYSINVLARTNLTMKTGKTTCYLFIF